MKGILFGGLAVFLSRLVVKDEVAQMLFVVEALSWMLDISLLETQNDGVFQPFLLVMFRDLHGKTSVFGEMKTPVT